MGCPVDFVAVSGTLDTYSLEMLFSLTVRTSLHDKCSPTLSPFSCENVSPDCWKDEMAITHATENALKYLC